MSLDHSNEHSNASSASSNKSKFFVEDRESELNLDKQVKQKGSKELEMMTEENNNNNETNNNRNSTSSYYSSAQRESSRSSSALSSNECDDLEESSFLSSESSSKGVRNSQYLSSSSTSGAEDSNTPEPPLEQLKLDSSEDSEDNQTTIEESASLALVQLNQYINLIPETKEANQAVDFIRLRFLEDLKQTKSADDLYEESDLLELRKPLPPPEKQDQSLAFRMISRFMRFDDNLDLKLSETQVDDLVEKLKDFLKFRHQYQVPLIRPDQFCKEFYLLHGIFPFGHDKQHLPVLYLRARVHRRWSTKLDESFRRYVSWQINTITKSYSGAHIQKTIGRNQIEKDGSFGICFDCLDVSYSCVDMDFLRFLVRCFVHYYPTYCRYALCVDLPWLFRSVWKLVRSWLPEEAQNTVQLITSKQLTDYIDEDQIPNSIRLDDNEHKFISEKRKHSLPTEYESIRSIDELAKELQLSSSEKKSFKTHLEKVLKEYKQLGAV